MVKREIIETVATNNFIGCWDIDKKICKEIIESTGASSIKDMGKIMGALKKKYSDSIDFSKANIIIKGLLN